MPTIAFKHVSKHFETPHSQVEVLKNVSISLKASSTTAVVGPSGSGKTTLLSLAAGLEVADSGNVLLEGANLSTSNEEERTKVRLENIGFIFQSFELIPTLSALENVMVPAELAGNSNCENRALELLDEVGLKQRVKHLPSELSGGERQRVAIARAFINKPKILLADEPTGNLDRETGERVIELLFELNQKHGTTLLIATHDIRIAERCSQVLRFSADGSLTESST